MLAFGRDVGRELSQQAAEGGDLRFVNPFAEPAVESVCSPRESAEQPLAFAGHLDDVHAPVFLMAPAREEPVALHCVEMVRESRLTHPYCGSQRALACVRANLQIQQHEPDRKGPPRLHEHLIKRAQDAARRARELKSDRDVGRSHSVSLLRSKLLTSKPLTSKLIGMSNRSSGAMSATAAMPKQQGAHYPDLAGRVAVVTGGSRGIGAATCRAMAANGASVALIARDAEALSAQTQAIIADGGQALAVKADCTVAERLLQASWTIAERLGPPEILVAFAGGDGAPVATVEESAAHWRAVLEGNLTATFLTVQAFLPAMIERGRGAIITMSSSAARQVERTSAAYAAAKAGVMALTRQLASEAARHGIRVNCLAPASTLNERMQTHMSEHQLEQLAATFPLGRIAAPCDIADAALFLASDASSWITGITLDVAGGKVMR